ncbi:porin [Niabella insulamsoli]|uniref:porin n=1 Tax=Niabella insulamsoli TaxID=3144874 RepID=UPI0031FD16DB
MEKIIAASLMLFVTDAFAQPDSAKPPLTFSGYIEGYYSYDFGNPTDHNRPAFAYSFNRHNEVNLNLGFLKATYQTDIVRANLALATGTYMNANLAAEPGVLKNIYEANAGVKISKTKDLWIEAGVFASHIGFESAVGKDCWNLTRSMLAENSPYYESGAKISYTTGNGHWFLSGLILNGWQRIQRVEGNNTPAFGHQLTYTPHSKITINSSSFVGSDKPDSTRQMRYFHNFYGQFQIHEKLALIAGFDIGAEQKAKGSGDYNTWYASVVGAKYAPVNRISIAARGEYYNDINGVIISTGTSNGFQTWGYSVNADYLIRENVLWRIEGRGFSSKDNIFLKDGDPINNNIFVTTSLAVSF